MYVVKSILFSHIHFSATFRASGRRYSCVRAYITCPDKAAQMYFGRVWPKPVLEMIEFPQIVQTMMGQVICADLSAFSRFYRFR